MPSRESLGSRAEACGEPAAAALTSLPSHASAVFALQRSAGNHAVTSLLGASRASRAHLARRPEDWGADPTVQKVLGLARGWNLFVTKWPPVQDATKAYAGLRTPQRAERTAA